MKLGLFWGAQSCKHGTNFSAWKWKGKGKYFLKSDVNLEKKLDFENKIV